MKTLLKNRHLFLIVLCFVAVAGCGRTKSKTPGEEKKRVEKEIGYGKLTGRTYTNNYFNLTVHIPEKWHVATKAETEQQIKDSLKQFNLNVGGEAEQLSLARSLRLLTISKQKYGSQAPSSFNRNIAIVAERIGDARSQMPTMQTYLQEVVKTMRRQNLNVVNHDIEHGFTIGKIRASRMRLEILLAGNKVFSDMYCAFVGDYALMVMLGYGSPDGLKELETIFNTIEASN